jgi:predicted cobalt transporter CbtA
MSVAGPLVAIGLALLFAGLYRAATARRLFGEWEHWGLVCLGAAMLAAGLELLSHGVN